MKHDFNQFGDQALNELPAPLPPGERVIWQGKPTFSGLALRSFHIRDVAVYFAVMIPFRLAWDWSHGLSLSEAAQSASLLLLPAAISIAVLAGLAFLFRRAACYTITSKRVLFQFGVALPMTVNVPLSKIGNAALRTYRDGSGDIPLRPIDSARVSYALLWPHIRPWRLRNPEPTLISIPDAARVAARLTEALTGQPGPVAIALAQRDAPQAGAAAMPHSPHVVTA
jgi:hypothetical protein